MDPAAVLPLTIDTAGTVFLCVSVGFVTLLMLWCFARVLRLPPVAEESGRDRESHPSV
jgi:hypothetical protein